MKLKISKLSSKPITTKYGTKNRVSFQCNGEWYSAFQNPYTDAWHDGMEIDVEVERNGKFNNIQFPRDEAVPRASGNGYDIGKDLAEIKAQLRAITSLLRGGSGLPDRDDPVHSDDDRMPY